MLKSQLHLALLGVGLVSETHTSHAQSTPKSPAPAQESYSATTQHEPSDRLQPRRAWAAGVTAGYFGPTEDTRTVDVNPLTFEFGVLVSWTTRVGVWFGVEGSYFLGKDLAQSVTPLGGVPVNFVAKTKLVSVGGVVGFDYPLGPLVARHTLGLGASVESWNFGDIGFESLGYYAEMSGTAASFYLAPGFALVLPLGRFYLGPELSYRVEFTGRLPDSLGARLHAGVRF